jgi:hypothetical protein
MPLETKVSLFQHALHGLRLSSGVYRTTCRGRFEHLNRRLNELLGARFDRTAALEVQDWAASDCLTSAEWASSLFAEFPKARLTASDLTLFFVEADLPGGESFILEPNGEALQYIRPPFVIRLNPPERRLLAVNWLLCRHASSKLRELRRRWAIPAAWLDSDSETLDQPPFVFRKISLVHPEAEILRRSSTRFAVQRHSVFEPLAEPCDAIRTMNIFNPGYFDEPRLREGARAVWLSLRQGGIWAVGRTWQDDPPKHRASVFAKEDRGFRLLDRYDGGSEIDELIASADLAER